MADAFCVVILSEVDGSIESPYYYKFYYVFKFFYFIYIKGVKNEKIIFCGVACYSPCCLW